MKKIARSLQRIKRQKEISILFQSPKQWKNDLFKILFKKNSLPFDRMAVLVSKKNGPAVIRNRIKRVIREGFFNTPVVDPPFYDILICPRYSSSEKMERVKEKYKAWRFSLKK